MKTERDLQARLRTLCRLNGVSFDKVESRSRVGFPDCFLACRGRIILVELKSPSGRGRVSASQARVIASLRKSGVQVEVLSDLDGIKAVVAECANLSLGELKC